MKRLIQCAVLSLLSVTSFCQWNTDTASRNPICTLIKNQYSPRLCSDGSGGAIITWVDERNSSSASVYAQRISKTGKTLWAANGILVYDPAINGGLGADYSAIVPDNSGGAIIIYQSSIIGGARQIFAQHINATGSLLWGNGVKLTDGYDSRLNWAESPEESGISADGSGGAFITWQGYQATHFIYAQHIDANGNLVWGISGAGLPLINGSNGYTSTIVSTGGGTAVVGYTDAVYGFYLQRLAANGAYLWGPSGLLVSTVYNFQSAHILTYDGVSATPAVMAAFVTQSTPGSSPRNITTQKIDLNGNILWKPGGVNITNAISDQSQPDIIPDNKGGAFLIYDSTFKAKVQHISSKGKSLWGTNGITIDGVSGSSQANPVIVSDGGTGIISVFYDSRNGYPDALFTQHYNVSGTALWRTNAVPIITNHVNRNHQVNPTIAATKGYAITCWTDERDLATGDNIYVAHFGGAAGFQLLLSAAEQQIANAAQAQQPGNNSILQVYPNPASNIASVYFALKAAEKNAVLELYDANAKKLNQSSLGNLAAGKHSSQLNLTNVPAGVYNIVLRCGSGTWNTALLVTK